MSGGWRAYLRSNACLHDPVELLYIDELLFQLFLLLALGFDGFPYDAL